MKNLRFCVASLILSAVIVISGYSIIRSGSGLALMLGNKITAAENAENIQGSSLTPYDKQPVVIPDKATELTSEILGSITIDGISLSVPMKLGELPDEFSYRTITYAEEKDKNGKMTGKYNGIYKLIYNEQAICNFIISDTKAVPDENTIINRFSFSSSTNKYLPQITVAGFDVSDTNIRDFNRIYGYDSDEYGYSTLKIKEKDRRYYISLSPDSNSIYGVGCFENTDTAIAYYPHLWIYEPDNIVLPENYTPENDEANNAMEYIPIPEKNDELKELITNFDFMDTKISLPCTLNSLAHATSKTFYFNNAEISGWQDEYGKFVATVRLGPAYVDVLITPGQPLGDAQVIEISGYSSRSEELIEQIKADNPYGFNYIEKFDIYYLTDYERNNIKIEGSHITYSYWPENLTKRNK